MWRGKFTEISFSGSFTEDELAAAFRLGRPIQKWFTILYWIICACAAVGFLYELISGPQSDFVPFIFMVWLFIGLTSYFTPTKNARKVLAQNSEYQNQISGVVSEEGLSIQASQAQTQSQWTIYRSARLSPGYVLLYQLNNTFNVYPRKFFATEADWLAFRALVEQKIANKSYSQKDPTAPLFGQHANLCLIGAGILCFIVLLVYNFKSIGN